MRRLSTLVLAIAGAMAPAIVVSGAAAAQGTSRSENVGIRLLEAPSNRADDPRARQYVVDHLEPGSTIERRFEVTNSTKDPITVELYAAAARVHEGSFVLQDGRASNELTSWTRVEPARLTLASGGRGTGKATISVPESARGGERYAVLWAELPPASSPSGVNVVNRVGIRVYLSVGGDEEPPTSFNLPTFTPTRGEDGRPGVDIRACNDGGRAVDLAGELELTEGPAGQSAGPYPSDTGTTLAPGECGNVAVRIDPEIPLGPWKATARLRSGSEEREATARIRFPAAAGTAGTAVKAKPRDVTGTAGGRLALLVALLLLLLVLALLSYLWRRRRRKEPEGE